MLKEQTAFSFAALSWDQAKCDACPPTFSLVEYTVYSAGGSSDKNEREVHWNI